MKLMFASDIHGSAYYCRKMLEAFQEEKAERLVLLGDILYHGPRNDLPKEYAAQGGHCSFKSHERQDLCRTGKL